MQLAEVHSDAGCKMVSFSGDKEKAPPLSKIDCIVLAIQQQSPVSYSPGWDQRSVIEDYSTNPSASSAFARQVGGPEDPCLFFASRLAAYVQQLEREVKDARADVNRALLREEALAKLVERSLEGLVAKLNERLLTLVAKSSPQLARTLQKAKTDDGVDIGLLLKELQTLQDESPANNWVMIEGNGEPPPLPSGLSRVEEESYSHSLVSLDLSKDELGDVIDDLRTIEGFLGKKDSPKLALPPIPPGKAEIVLNGLVKTLRIAGSGAVFGLTSLFSLYREVIRAATFFGVATVVLQSPWTPVTQAVGSLLLSIIKKALHI